MPNTKRQSNNIQKDKNHFSIISNTECVYGYYIKNYGGAISIYYLVLDTCSIQNDMTLCSSARVVGLPCPG
jgi:hypothetical protein